MRNVLINGLLLTGKYAGVAYSIEHLLMAMSRSQRSDITLNVLVPADYSGSLTESHNFKLTPVTFNGARLGRIIYEHLQLPHHFSRGGFDLYHAPAYILPQFSAIPGLVTIHDLIAIDYPELCQYETALYFNLCLPQSIRIARKIFTVSEKVKQDILEKFPHTSQGKIEVVHHGINPIFKRVEEDIRKHYVRQSYNLPEKFILYVGNVEPKKNIETLIMAFNSLKKVYECDHELVIAGRNAWKFDEVFRLAYNSEFRKKIHFLGYVPEQHLPVLYSLASVFVFPSIYEGFGLPVLEAMACGCPVIAAESGALPEVCGSLADLVDAKNHDQLKSTIVRVLQSDLKTRNQEAIRWASRFTWDEAATKTLEVYRHQLEQCKVKQ